ncbi:hypothetical protein D3C85_1790140 [compost metagenome]
MALSNKNGPQGTLTYGETNDGVVATIAIVTSAHSQHARRGFVVATVGVESRAIDSVSDGAALSELFA